MNDARLLSLAIEHAWQPVAVGVMRGEEGEEGCRVERMNIALDEEEGGSVGRWVWEGAKMMKPGWRHGA